MFAAPQDGAPTPSRCPAILILGMHRSGTSACAGLLDGMGIRFGAAAELLPPNADNPLGYFEHRDLVRANQMLLVGKQASWLQAIDYGSPTFDPETVSPLVREQFEDIAGTLIEHLSRAGPWALKDPRLCLTLPCWRPLLTRPVCIHVIRHPVAAGLSLERRGAMPLPAGVALWELYQRRILAYTRDLPVLRVHFEALLQDPRACESTIRDFLAAQGIDGLEKSSEGPARSAVDLRLVHHDESLAPPEELLNAAQMALMQDLRQDRAKPGDVSTRLSIGATLILARHERARADDHRLAELENRLAAQARQLEASEEALSQLRLTNEDQDARLRIQCHERTQELRRTYTHLLNQARVDAKELQRICEGLLKAAQAAFGSLTWRSGRSFKRVVLALQGRDEGVTAEQYVRSLAEQLDRWMRNVDSKRRTGTEVAALAALWTRMNRRTHRLIAARFDESWAWNPDEPPDVPRRICLSLLDARSDIAVLPVTAAELPRAPADVLLVQFSAAPDSDEVAALISRSLATEAPILCVVDGGSALRTRSVKTVSRFDRLPEPAGRLLDAAKVIITLDADLHRALVAAGYEERLLGPLDTPGRDTDSSNAPSRSDREIWRAALARLEIAQANPRGVASFGWSRLPIVREQDFESDAYLSQNPDLTEAIHAGVIANAFDHWDRHGRLEVQRGERAYCPGIVLKPGGLWHLSKRGMLRVREHVESWPALPLVSVVMPTWNSDPVWLAAAVESVRNQAYPRWELCIADDGSTRVETLSYLRSLRDSRIKVRLLEVNSGIAAASDQALSMACGDYIALLDHDDLLSQDALYLVAQTIVEEAPDLIYSDEDKVTLNDSVTQAFHKPDYSPDQLLSQNYFSHFGVYRHDLIKAVGGFRAGYDGSQDYDLVLRCTARTSKVAHIPHCLYSWRMVPGSTAARFESKDYAWDAGRQALEDTLKERHIDGDVELGRYPGTYRVRRRIRGTPLVSIVIPFRDQGGLLRTCLDSLLEHTGYAHFEILGVSNDSVDTETYRIMSAYERRDRRIRFIRHDVPFNFSRINNAAARQAKGEHLLFLNNDIEVLDREWLESLLEHSQRTEVGCVGARLLYPDRSLQHAGVIIGLRTLAGHAHRDYPEDAPGYFARPWIIHNVSAVTAACLMLKRSVFEDVGGFNEDDLAVAFNDVDLCLRVREQGLLNVYTPYCTLIHHESKSRGSEDTPEKQARFVKEVRFTQERYSALLATGDPYYNPNLTPHQEDFAVLTQLGGSLRTTVD